MQGLVVRLDKFLGSDQLEDVMLAKYIYVFENAWPTDRISLELTKTHPVTGDKTYKIGIHGEFQVRIYKWGNNAKLTIQTGIKSTDFWADVIVIYDADDAIFQRRMKESIEIILAIRTTATQPPAPPPSARP